MDSTLFPRENYLSYVYYTHWATSPTCSLWNSSQRLKCQKHFLAIGRGLSLKDLRDRVEIDKEPRGEKTLTEFGKKKLKVKISLHRWVHFQEDKVGKLHQPF